MRLSASSVILVALVGVVACGNGAGDAAQRSPAVKPARTLIEAHTTVADTSAAPKDTFWVGRSGGYAIEWTWRDIVVDNAAGERVLSIRSALDRASADAGTPVESDDVADTAYGACTLEYHLQLRSVVGSIVSLERLQYLSCRGAAHPSVHTSYVALDLARTEREGIVPGDGEDGIGREVSLTDLFPDEQVLAALLGDRLVQRRIEEIRGKTIRPRTTAELVALIEGGSECEYAFESDMLRSFAFHHVEGDRVAVRIGLSHGCEAARGRLTQIGILLPIPPALRTALESASRGTEGMLMREASKNLDGAVTLFAYRYRIDEDDQETP